MIDLYLFEIKCAEEIGDYRLADSLDSKLMRIASSNHREIQKKITRKVESDSAIKDVSFSNSRQKFIVSADQSLSNFTKREIQSLAGPYPVSFRYSNKTIDELMSGESEDPMQRHLNELEQLGPDYVGLDSLDGMEPSDEDLRFTAEHPENEFNEDPEDIDAFLLEFARDNMRTQPGY
jgi:hypothetical protein